MYRSITRSAWSASVSSLTLFEVTYIYPRIRVSICIGQLGRTLALHRMDITWDGTSSTLPADIYRRDHGHVHHATPLSPPQQVYLVAGSISELHRYGHRFARLVQLIEYSITLSAPTSSTAPVYRYQLNDIACRTLVAEHPV